MYEKDIVFMKFTNPREFPGENCNGQRKNKFNKIGKKEKNVGPEVLIWIQTV